MSIICPACNSEGRCINQQLIHHNDPSETVAICDDCNHLFLLQPASIDRLESYNKNVYQNSYESRSLLTILINNCQRSYRKSLLLNKISLQQKRSSPLSVLEIGPGLNPLYRKSDLSETLIDYDVVETDTSAIMLLKKYVENIYTSMLEIPPKKYDVIVAFQVLEHIPDIRQFIVKIKDHLSDRGVAILEVPYIDYLRQTKTSFFPHLHSFSESSFKKLISTNWHGLYKIQIIKSGYRHSYTLWLYKMVERLCRCLPDKIYCRIGHSVIKSTPDFLNPFRISLNSCAIWITGIIINS